MATDAAAPNANIFLTLGEAMIRLQPIDDGPVAHPSRHLPQAFLRSVGGDELNVAVALSLLGLRSRWISVVPKGPMGDVITESCKHHGVEFAGWRPGGDLGIYTMLPELKTVHYQRRQSAFAQQNPDSFHWSSLLAGPRPWFHVTGITPLVSPSAWNSWDAALRQAAVSGIPTSLDLNHRKQLGTLEELWTMVVPHCERLEVLILSLEQLNGLAFMQIPGHIELTDVAEDAQCLAVMRQLHQQWRCKRVALPRKTRDSVGIQRRWSLLTELPGFSSNSSTDSVVEYTTKAQSVFHRPADECGGGSAWAAGLIHALHIARASTASQALR